MSGRCSAILSNGKRCPNAALPGSRYCGLPAHQALADVEGDHVASPADDPVVIDGEDDGFEEGSDDIAAEAEAVDVDDELESEDEAPATEAEESLVDEPDTPSGAADSITPHDGESITSQTEAPGTDPHPEDAEIAEELGVGDEAEEHA
jgi:N utilization substance protein A